MGKSFRQLQRDDRLKIGAWLQDKIPVQTIAERLQVNRSTIYREIKRGWCLRRNSDWTEKYVYDPDVGERHYQEHLKERGRELKIGNDLELIKALECYMIDGCSPAAALAKVEKEDKKYKTKICLSTVYNYIKGNLFLNITMKELPAPRHKRKKKQVRVQKRAQAGDSISLRPDEINSREEFGHWEMDTVVGSKGSSKVLLVLTERKTRNEIIEPLRNKSAAEVVRALDRIEREMTEKVFRKLFKTITMDNGTEFSDVKGIERSRRGKQPRTKSYYCHPYSSWERGSNENNNKLIRRKVPKGINFDDKTRKEIKEIEEWVNAYPRAIFDFETAHDVYTREFELLMAS